MTIRQIVLAALTASLSAAPPCGGRTADGKTRQACYDLAKAGPDEWAGPSAVDRAPDEWAYRVRGER